MSGGLRAAKAAGLSATATDEVAAARAARLRRQIDNLTGQAQGVMAIRETQGVERAKRLDCRKWRS